MLNDQCSCKLSFGIKSQDNKIDSQQKHETCNSGAETNS